MTTANDVLTVPPAAPGTGFRLWRHSHAAVRSLPGAHLGDRSLEADPAEEARHAYELGARFVAIGPTADLGPDADARQTVAVLSLVRELTAYGMEIDWRLRLVADGPEWWVFNHLFPPALLDFPGGDEALEVWRSRFHVGRCFLRRGPGFVQIRDRRNGGFRRMTIADARYRAAIDALQAGEGTREVPEPIVSAFVKQHLLVWCGTEAWWAPHRLHRWPLPSWEV